MKMIRFFAVLLIFAWFVCVAGGCAEVGGSESPTPDILRIENNTADPDAFIGKTISILFIGNSYTYYGDLPAQIATLAKMYGITIESTSICPGGASLTTTKRRAIEEMENHPYDFAVFQDQGMRPIQNSSIDFFADVHELCDAAKKNGAAPVLYNPAGAITWLPNGGVKPNIGLQAKLTAAHEQAAAETGAVLVNAGDAWVYAYEQIPDISLFVDNGRADSHANAEGAYFTACVFCSTLFGLEIKDPAADNLYNGDNAVALGQIAWEFVSYYKMVGKYPDESFTVLPGTNEIQ